MTWISDYRLVSAVSSAGAFGLLAAGNAPVEVLREQIQKTREATPHPFGVNLITVAPNYLDHLALAAEMRVPTIVFAGSIPRGSEIQRAKDSGAKVICFAATGMLAHKTVDQGADALMLEGSEAGGHIGPVSLVVLLQQILFKVQDVPVFVAGGVARGQMIVIARAAQSMVRTEATMTTHTITRTFTTTQATSEPPESSTLSQPVWTPSCKAVRAGRA